MAFVGKDILRKISNEATMKPHPMLEDKDIPLNVREAYFQGCVLAVLAGDGGLDRIEHERLDRIGASLQLSGGEIAESKEVVKSLDSDDERKEGFVREIFGLVKNGGCSEYFLNDSEELLFEGWRMRKGARDYWNQFGIWLIGRQWVAESRRRRSERFRKMFLGGILLRPGKLMQTDLGKSATKYLRRTNLYYYGGLLLGKLKGER